MKKICLALCIFGYLMASGENPELSLSAEEKTCILESKYEGDLIWQNIMQELELSNDSEQNDFENSIVSISNSKTDHSFADSALFTSETQQIAQNFSQDLIQSNTEDSALYKQQETNVAQAETQSSFDSFNPIKPARTNSYICPDCGLIYKNYLNFIKHKHIHENQMNTKTLNNSQIEIGKSKRKFDEQEDQSVICTLCLKKFSTTSSVNKHKKSKHYQEKYFQCNHCDYASFEKADLDKHILRKHLKEKPWECRLCEHVAASKQDLETHMRFKHTKEKPHICPECNGAFATSSKLLTHARNEHFDKMPYKCTQCGKAFLRIESFNRHVCKPLGT
jgi:DNA-directed RNA polymerase subunit RPC12/RpoP